MGLKTRLKELFEPNYHQIAHTVIGEIRQPIRAVHGRTLETARLIEAKEMKRVISVYANKGGKVEYKKALALWQHGKALYPEWITDADKPSYVQECWKCPSIPDTDS